MTPAIYQSNRCINASHASHLPIKSPRWAKSPRIHSTSYAYTNIQKHSTQQLTRRQAFNLDIEPTHGQPASYRARPVTIDDGLEDIMWIRCLGDERLPTAFYALCPNLNKLLFSPREEGSRYFVVCFLHPSRRYTFDIDV